MFGVALDKVLELGAREKKKSSKSAQSTFIPLVVMDLVKYLSKPGKIICYGVRALVCIFAGVFGAWRAREEVLKSA